MIFPPDFEDFLKTDSNDKKTSSDAHEKEKAIFSNVEQRINIEDLLTVVMLDYETEELSDNLAGWKVSSFDSR
jgi:hypothetical protein